METPPSRIYKYRRVLGFVSNEVPLAVRYILKTTEHVIYTVVGKSFHTYGSSKLRLMSVSQPHPDDINYIACNQIFVFTACQNVVRAFKRGIQLSHTFTGHDAKIHLIVPFGSYLISVDEKSGLKIWNLKTEELSLELDFDNETFCISTVLHPSGYVNKILLGSKQGRLQLWNVKTSKLIHTFNGWNSGVVVTEQAPAADVIAVGLESGDIIIHNFKYDETIVRYSHEWGPTIGISFRLDGEPLMASATTAGHIIIWDLEKKRLLSMIRKAHRGAVTGLHFFSNEPILITSSSDNSLKMWLFDQPDGSGRIHKSREGHCAPPLKIRYYGSEGYIMSAGQDSTLRMFSVVADILHKSLGQASFNRSASIKKGVSKQHLKMPAITNFASEMCREKEWDNVVCCHKNMGKVTTWSTNLCKMGKHKLLHERFSNDPTYKNAVAVCTHISSCGNFVLIGFDSGHADMFNIQSGIFRGQYGVPKAHKKGIRGIVSDNLNQQTITGSSDATIKFWNFKTKKLTFDLKVSSGVSQFLLHKESGLLAVSYDDFSINIIDIITRKIIRIFSGFVNRITDMTFSIDSRWLVAASMDCSLRTYDIPTAQLIDHFLVESACTSLDMSPSGEYLSTTHVDDLGIYLWTNCTIFSHVNLKPLSADHVPLLYKLTEEVDEDAKIETSDEKMDEDIEVKSKSQISDDLVTLSLLPHSRWHNLLVLDVIKAKNKPKEPIAKPKQAPFFLPTVPGLEFQFAVKESTDKRSLKRVSYSTSFLSDSELIQTLMSAEREEMFEAALNMLKQMGPAQIEIELRSLGLDNGGSVDLLERFLEMIRCTLKSNKDFEAAQAFLGLFLKLHWADLASNDSIRNSLEELQSVQRESWDRLNTEFNQSLCLINFFKNAYL